MKRKRLSLKKPIRFTFHHFCMHASNRSCPIKIARNIWTLKDSRVNFSILFFCMVNNSRIIILLEILVIDACTRRKVKVKRRVGKPEISWPPTALKRCGLHLGEVIETANNRADWLRPTDKAEIMNDDEYIQVFSVLLGSVQLWKYIYNIAHARIQNFAKGH